jgi:hypothetical protein
MHQDLAPRKVRSKTCPLCGGRLAKARSVTEDDSKLSKNLSVWNGSECGNPLHDALSDICKRCWHAYAVYPDGSHRWERSSELPDSFHHPLTPAIRRFPLPSAEDIKSSVVYSQQFVGTRIEESVFFWCTDSPDLIASFREYAEKHRLSIRVKRKDPVPGEVTVCVEITPKRWRR